MADLKFNQLAAEFTTDTITVSNGTTPLPPGVYITVGKVIGGTGGLALTDEGVTELMIKLLKAANKAQTTNNAGANAVQINSFPLASYGTPQLTATGDIEASVFASVTGILPISDATIKASV
jgi:hypothetical protein